MCKECKYWDKEWFREPKNDPEGVGYRFCNHPGFIGGMKWGAMVVPENANDCDVFEKK